MRRREGWRTDDDRTVTEFYVAEVSLREGTRCDEPQGQSREEPRGAISMRQLMRLGFHQMWITVESGVERSALQFAEMS